MVVLQFIFVLFTLYFNNRGSDKCKLCANLYINNEIKEKSNAEDSITLHSGIRIPSKNLQNDILVTYPNKDGVLVSKVYTFQIGAFKTIIE